MTEPPESAGLHAGRSVGDVCARVREGEELAHSDSSLVAERRSNGMRQHPSEQRRAVRAGRGAHARTHTAPTELGRVRRHRILTIKH